MFDIIAITTNAKVSVIIIASNTVIDIPPFGESSQINTAHSLLAYYI